VAVVFREEQLPNMTKGLCLHCLEASPFINRKPIALKRGNSMSRKIKISILLLLAFFIPGVIILAALAGLRITPFGENTLAISDGNALYLNYLGYVARALKGQEDILFSFEKGIGGNMIVSWGWFLLNPFFPLFVLFDITQYMTAFTWVSVLNFCFCGLTMYLLLADLYGHKQSNLIFSTAYAMNGFLVANVFQMNFFTGVATLPLMILGLRKILLNKNPIIYILSLAYSLLTNFYFGFMLCVASLLFFMVFFIAKRTEIRNRKAVIIKYTFSSLLAGLLSSVIWLPAILSLQGGRLDQPVVNEITFKENMPFLEMASKLFTGANTTSELQNGLPNIFVGILPVALLILFFMNRNIKKEFKSAAAILLGVYLVSFYVVVFNLIMHGGTTTNWFNYRDSFVFCFIMLLISSEEWQHIDGEPNYHFKKAAVILVIGALLVFNKQYEYVSGSMVLIDFAILALMFLAFRMYKQDPKKNPRRTMEVVVLILMCLNLFINYRICTKNILVWTHEESEYQGVVMTTSAMVEAVKKSDAGFYRMEIGEQRTRNSGNDPMLYGYYGVSHSGSDDKNYVRMALNKLGIHRFDMRNYYAEGVPAATDTLLGLKYLISYEDLVEEKDYEKLINIGDLALYNNPDALPIAILSNAEVTDIIIDHTDVFDNLNSVWDSISGSDKSIFNEETEITFISYNLTDPISMSRDEAAEIVEKRDSSLADKSINSIDESSSQYAIPDFDNGTIGTLKEPPENMSYIEYTWTAKQDGPVYSYNQSGVTELAGSITPVLNYEGYYHKGETVTGYLPLTNSLVTKYLLEDVAGRFRAAYADKEALHELATIIKERTCTIERIKDSYLRGEFNAEAGQILMFTIPYDEGWTLTIDGKKAEINQVLGAFMATDIKPGEHTYEMTFFPAGMKTGIVLSIAALLIILVYIPIDSRRRKLE